MERAPLITTEIAALPPDTLLDLRALAASLKLSTRTVRRLIQRYELPRGIRLGGKHVWLVSALREFFQARAASLMEETRKEQSRLPNLLGSRPH